MLLSIIYYFSKKFILHYTTCKMNEQRYNYHFFERNSPVEDKIVICSFIKTSNQENFYGIPRLHRSSRCRVACDFINNVAGYDSIYRNGRESSSREASIQYLASTEANFAHKMRIATASWKCICVPRRKCKYLHR